MMLSIRGLYQILAYVYEIITLYSIKSLMVVPFMNLLKSTLSPIPYKCPVSESSSLGLFIRKERKNLVIQNKMSNVCRRKKPTASDRLSLVMVYVAMHKKTICKFLREPKLQT